MLKRSLAILCGIILTIIFPTILLATTTIGQDVNQLLPINCDMETDSEAKAIKDQLSAIDSTAVLTQDKVSGSYAVKVSVKDVLINDYASYKLTSALVDFTVSDYSKINLWVKPDVGAKWIQFYFNDDVHLIKSDKDANGRYEVGQDLMSGKWNLIELDLTKMDSSLISGKDLKVRTNEYSTWSYDEIKSCPDLTYNIDLSRVTSSKTEYVNGELKFKKNGDKYAVSPVTLVTNRYPSFERVDTLATDFQQPESLLDKASVTAQGSVDFQLIDACAGGTAISGGDYSSNSAAQAFDDDSYYTLPKWYSLQTSPNVNGNAYIGYNFGTAKNVKWVRIKQPYLNNSIHSAKLQYYNETAQNWQDGQIIDLIPSSDWQVFSVSTSVSASKWRLFANSNTLIDYNNWVIQEIEFLTESGSYTSPEINISAAIYSGNSVIDWNASYNTELIVQTSLSTNGGTTWTAWKTSTKGGSIQDIPENTNLTNVRLKYKVSVKPTSTSTPQLYDISIKVLGGNYSDAQNIGNGKLSSVTINSDYIYKDNHIEKLPEKIKTVPYYDENSRPLVLAISGDGSKLFYRNNSVYPVGLYMYDLGTGANLKIGGYTDITKIKVNYDGSNVAFLNGLELFVYNSTTGIINKGRANDFFFQNDGTLFYDNTLGGWIVKGTQGIVPAITNLYHLAVPKSGNTVFYTAGLNLYICTLTPESALWKSEVLTTTSIGVIGLWADSTGTTLFLKLADGSLYSYHVASKAMRKLDIAPSSSPTIVRVLNDDRLVIQDKNCLYKIYNPDTDEYLDIRPEDAKNVYNSVGGTDFDVDESGKKMVYPSNDNTIKINYMDGAPRPERYLLSFDGKKSWYSHKDSGWVLVSTEFTPTKNDFDQYGMTIDKVNSLNKGDFATLYEGGNEIYNVDAAIYFTSIDPSITPSLKSIKVTVDRDNSVTDNLTSRKALFAAKQEPFVGTGWRKIKKVYPVEISPKESEFYYFFLIGGTYKYYDQGLWKEGAVGEIGALLGDVEKNWIKITQLGMSAEEMKAIPEAHLTSELARKNFSIVYCMKVYDASTNEYKSMLKVDRVNDMFTSTNLVLKITLNDGTLKQFTGLTDTAVEDIMQWINERQYNRGPIFYEIRTGTTHEFINYYMIQNISVVEQ